MTDPSPTSPVVHLHAAGVSAVIDMTGLRLPALLHWGPAISGLDAAAAQALVAATVPLVGPNTVDVPGRPSLVPEGWTGWPGRPGLSGCRRGGRGWTPRFVVQSASVDGVPVDGFVDAGAASVEVVCADSDVALWLTLRIEMLPSGLLRSRALLRNEGDPFDVHDLVLAYPLPGRAREIMDYAGRWAKEKVSQRRPLGVGTHLRENRKGRTGADAAGVLHVGVPGFSFGDGEVWGVHVGFSGNHTHYVEQTLQGDTLAGGGELLLPGEMTLQAGESYETPWLYGSYGDGLDAVAERFHRFLRARPHHVSVDRPVTINVWEAVYFDHDLDRLVDLAEHAAAIGVERFVLDDGWFSSRRDERSGLGDWVVSRSVWPQGLHPLVQAVTSLGMQFGLWFEPEMVNPDSELARAHPEWLMSASTQPGDRPVEFRHQQVLNLAIPEAYDHVRDQMLALLDEYDISSIKWDHNRDLIDAGDQARGGAPGVHAQTLAFYRLIDELKDRHPGLEIESCSSGGSRIDLGVIERCDRVWVSDCIDPLERQQINRGTVQLIPPELMGSHVASRRSHSTGRMHDLSFRAATALLGHFGVEWDLTEASESELADLQAWVGYYKARRRGLFTGRVVRVDTGDETVNVYGVVADDRRTATFLTATVGRAIVSPRPRLCLRELDPDLTYRIEPVLVGTLPSGLAAPAWWGASHTESGVTRHEGIVLPGSVLMGSGVQPPSLDPEQIVIYELRAVDPETER